MRDSADKKARRAKTDRQGLRPFYLIMLASSLVGIIMVFLLNLSTPIEFMLSQWQAVSQLSWDEMKHVLSRRLGVLTAITLGVALVTAGAMHWLVAPLRECLPLLRAGEQPEAGRLHRARRRLLNLPFLSIPLTLFFWLVIPGLVFLGTYSWTETLSFNSAMVMWARSVMVGMIAAAVGFFWSEAYARRSLNPLFFPEGRLSDIQGVARLSISRRIRAIYRMGTMIPLTIMLITLVTLQFEVDPAAEEVLKFGRGIIIFTVVLAVVFFFTTGALNRLVSRSVQEPLNRILRAVDRVRAGDYTAHVQVVSADELGRLGDATNEMIRGLAERETLRNAFGKYVTPEIRDEILAGRIPLEGERRQATVLFADLRGFTPLVEHNAPEEVMESMRQYFTAMHLAIRGRRGVVLQFVGDEIEAAFGVPVAFADHADQAVAAALEMRAALAELNQNRVNHGRPALAHGVGIHSGPVLAGISGSRDQSAYALIGTAVNLASRIQGLTKVLGGDILISGQTARMLSGSYKLDEQPPQTVAGVSRPVTVLKVLA